ncbi:MAG: polyphosphate kinase 1, partial [Planctomycetota bacterium]
MSQFAPEHFLNRELSFLQFNRRVLAEAERDEIPPLERLRFLGIVSSNLDEFFMVRVALTHRAVEAKAGPLGPDRTPPRQVLARIAEAAHALVDRQYACLNDAVLPALAAEGVHIVRPAAYTDADRETAATVFREQIAPALTPLAVDPAHPFPLLANCSIFLLLRIRARPGADQQFYNQTDTVLVQAPPVFPRFFRLPADGETARYALLEDLIRENAHEILRGYDIESAHAFRVTRDADITVDEEQAENLLAALEEQLRNRRHGAPVRLEVEADTPEPIVELLCGYLEVEEAEVYRAGAFVDLKGLFGLVGLVDRPDLCYAPWPPVPHPLFLGGEHDIFALMREQDFVLHHPYHMFDPVVELVERAAADPDVLAIKITLYRVSGDSPIVQALMRAAEAGKQVTALVELKARFDEEANIQWARRLERAGAHVIYGVVGYKTHSKALLVVRREPDGIRRYAHLP